MKTTIPFKALAAFSAAFLLGILGTLPHGIWPAWWLSILSMLGLMLLLFFPSSSRHAARKSRLAFTLTLVWGLGFYGLGVSWLYISMHRYGGMPAPFAAAGVLAMAVLLASFGAIAAGLAQRLSKSAPQAALLFAGFWAIAEWARNWAFTGFPWLAQGYAQIDGPFTAFAPLIGVYGVSAVVCVLSAALATFIASLASKNKLWFANSTLGLLTIGLTVGVVANVPWQFTRSEGRALSVQLVQGNVPQDMKFDPVRARASMQRYADTIARSRAQLTVLPETAWIVPLDRTPADLSQLLQRALQSSNTTLALGTPIVQGSTYFNSVAVLNAQQQVGRYDKRHLVPFGEFIPPGFRWFVDLMHIPLGDFGRGTAGQTLLSIADAKVGFNICYEDLFGDELAEQVRQGATILVNLSNIAWFGDSHALPQHLMIARMRSLELGRPMLRATNTGATAYIDADGQVIAQLRPLTEAVLDVQVVGRSGLTPFGRWGNAPALLLCALLAGICLFRSRR